MWEQIATKHLAPLKITPFEAKVCYALPLMRNIVEGGMGCLKADLHLPAYVLVADAAEALGRCLTGCQREVDGSTARLRAGLTALIGSSFTTPARRTYTVAQCASLRHFTTHGGTTPKAKDALDAYLTRHLINQFGVQLSGYWTRLGQDGHPDRTTMAAARISPLWTGGQLVFVEDMVAMMSAPGAQAGQGIHV